MKRARPISHRVARFFEIAAMEPEQFVVQVRYIDSDGSVTDRPVSPLRQLTPTTWRVYCLGREAIRTFDLQRVMRVQLRFSIDVLAPEKIQTLAHHSARQRRREENE